MKEKIKGIIPYIIILIIVIIVRSFIVTPVRVNGESMEETLHEGEMLILNKFDDTYEYGDIVVLNKDVTGSAVIKRIIGLPGETVEIENGIVYINEEKIEDEFSLFNEDDDMEKMLLGENEYFVLGDNRAVSLDSRIFGMVNISDIEGTVTFRIFPFDEFGNIE